MRTRDVGGMGESEAIKWLNAVGIIPNKVENDKGGWDYFLQWPDRQKQDGEPASLDHLPSPISCLLQVKATDTGKAPKIKLSNWRRMCQDAIPSFVLLLHFDNDIYPKSAHLVHVDKKWIEKILKKMRQLPAEKASSLHKEEISLSWNDNDKLDEPWPQSLKSRIEAVVGPDPAVYSKKKQSWIREAGYDEGGNLSIRFAITPDKEKTAHDRLVDLALGLAEGLPVTHEGAEEVRFGISKPYDLKYPRELTIRFGSFPGQKVTLSLVQGAGKRLSQIDGEFFDPRAILPFLKDDEVRFKFKTDFMDLIMDGARGKIHLRSREIHLDDELSLSKIGSYAEFMRALRAAEPESARDLKLAIRFEGNRTFMMNIGSPSFGEPTSADLEFEQAAADAWSVGRAFNLSPEHLVTPRELHSFAWHLENCRTLLEATGASDVVTINGEVSSEASPSDDPVGMSVVAPAFVGKTLVVVAAAVYGRPTFGDVLPNGRRRFGVRDPSIKVVLKEVLDDATQGRQSMRPYHERVREWMSEHGVEPLPENGSDVEGSEN